MMLLQRVCVAEKQMENKSSNGPLRVRRKPQIKVATRIL